MKKDDSGHHHQDAFDADRDHLLNRLGQCGKDQNQSQLEDLRLRVQVFIKKLFKIRHLLVCPTKQPARCGMSRPKDARPLGCIPCRKMNVQQLLF